MGNDAKWNRGGKEGGKKKASREGEWSSSSAWKPAMAAKNSYTMNNTRLYARNVLLFLSNASCFFLLCRESDRRTKVFGRRDGAPTPSGVMRGISSNKWEARWRGGKQNPLFAQWNEARSCEISKISPKHRVKGRKRRYREDKGRGRILMRKMVANVWKSIVLNKRSGDSYFFFIHCICKCVH